MSDERTWTVLELLKWTTRHFEGRGIETARLDAECLLAEALGIDRLRLYLDFDKPVEAEERARFRALVLHRAEERVPVAQILGRKEFWSLDLRVTPDVLVPRPDTETLVSAALDRVSDREAELRILDLGTGSGAIALALAQELPKARITASDVSEPALAVARENAERLGFADRVVFVHGDGLQAVTGQRFDLVVSNPPYVAERDAEGLPPELAHEPREALFSGPLGTDMLLHIASEAGGWLEEGGLLAVELDPEQVETMEAALGAAGFSGMESVRDLAGRPRVVLARWRVAA